jgi:hypothetical protein
MYLHDPPDDLEIYAEVVVDDDVARTNNSTPFNSWSQIADTLRNSIGCLSQHLEIAQ